MVLSKPSSFAPFKVPAIIESIGFIPPHSTISVNSCPFVPCGITPASVPRAMVTRLATASLMALRIAAAAARAFSARKPFSTPLFAKRSTVSPAISVGTRNVPRSRIIFAPSSSKKEPCSIDETPARTAILIPSVPCAWAATLRSNLVASSTNAFISS